MEQNKQNKTRRIFYGFNNSIVNNKYFYNF